MKKILGTVLPGLLFFASCDRFVEPQSEKVDGDLSGCFELTGEKYQITDEDGSSQFIVTVRRTDQSVPYTPDVVCTFKDKTDESYYIAGFGYTLLDKEGKEIEEVDPDKAKLDSKEVLNLLTLKSGEEGELTIKIDKDKVPAKVALTTGLEFNKTGKIIFEGSIGKYAIKNMEVDFDFENKEIKGKYQYASSPAGAFVWWKGKIGESKLKQGKYVWEIEITENNDNGGWCGALDGHLVLSRDSETDEYFYTLPGEFTNFRFDKFETHLKSPVLTELYKDK